MNPKLALLLAVCVSAPCWAQAEPAAPAAPAATVKPLLLVDERVDRAEPSVKHTVTEDGGSKIDELVVRGQVQHVVVTPKVGVTRPYEIILSRGGREVPPDGTGGANSAVGKRVWNVLAF